jgi:Fic family protein
MTLTRSNYPTRSGRYVKQPSGYKAFIPEPLPPEPEIRIDSEMQRLLSSADRALGKLDGSIQTLPDPNLFVLMYVRKEAVLSSQIEGTQASINDVIKAEASIFDAERPSDVSEVINYIQAMNYGLKRLETLPVSRRLIQEIHERLMQNVRGYNMQPGELRTSQNWIGPKGCTLGEAMFVPPPHHVAEDALSDLELFWNENDNLPPLIKIGLMHAQFETIHPFLDGNGRIGRLLITFALCSKSLLGKPVLYISYYLKANREKYYSSLQGVRDIGDWETWLKFFLRGITEASDHATETARKIVSLREANRATIASHFGNHAGKASLLLESLYAQPYITINQTAKQLGISFPNASSLIDKFVRNDLLMEVTGNARNRVFMYTPYVSLFSSI